jgi:hypothetical protein
VQLRQRIFRVSATVSPAVPPPSTMTFRTMNQFRFIQPARRKASRHSRTLIDCSACFA